MDKYSLISAVREGKLQKVKKLINSFHFFNSKERYDLLLLALERNNRDIAKLLLLNDSKVNSNNEPSITPLHYAATHGDVEIVKMLLDRNARIDDKDKYGQTSLHHAVERNQIKVVKLLLNRRACINASDRDGITPLHIASRESCSDIVKTLLNYDAYVNPTSYLTSSRQHIHEGYTPLHFAVEKGNQEITKLLLKNNANINIKVLCGTPLHIAAEEGYPQIAKDLLDYGAYVNSVCTLTGYTPLHVACSRGNTEVVRLLLIKGADANAVAKKDNIMPLYLATEKGHGTIVKLLLEHGADVNVQDKYVNFKASHGSLLHIAAQKEYRQIVEYLLNHGASVNTVCTSTGYTPLYIASANGSLAIGECILSKGADVDIIANNSLTPLHAAVEKGHRSIVKLLLEHGADVDAQDEEGRTVLHRAAAVGIPPIIEDILMFCPDLNNESNKSSLNVAIYNSGFKCENIIENLLEYGFTVNTRDINNCKLLDSAVRIGYLEIVEDLLQNGADVNMTSIRGYTLLHTATSFQQEEIAELLIRYGADVNAKDDYNKTPLSFAVANLDLKFTKLLLTHGANIKDYPDMLKTAIKAGCSEIVEILLQYNCDIDLNACNKSGKTALHATAFSAVKGNGAKLRRSRRAIANSRTRKASKIITQMHLDKRAFVNAKKEDGTTALHIATYRGHERIVNILLKYGAEVDARAKCDMTPLHVAAQSGHPGIVKILLRFGANIDSVDKYRRTALHIACEGRHGNVVMVLLQNGIDVNILTEDDLSALDSAMPESYYWQFEPQYNDYDSGVDEFYEEIHYYGQYPREKLAEILIQHIAKMMAQNLPVNKQYLRRIDDSSTLNQIYITFENEIWEMENEQIGDTSILFHDILTRDVHQLAIYARNKSVVEVFETGEYKEMFPRYADTLEDQFQKGMDREGLLKSNLKSFNSLFGYNLPHLFINEMFSYLSNSDLRNLSTAYPHDVSRS